LRKRTGNMLVDVTHGSVSVRDMIFKL